MESHEADVRQMRAELARILADPVLVRSPILARLLAYLVEATIKGQGKTLKSYSVAVDGLGRGPDFNPQIDTYARVQVGRLRKVLNAHYAGSGAQQTLRLQIETGSYEVSLVGNAVSPEPGPALPRIGLVRPGGPLGKYLLAGGLVLLITLGLWLGFWWQAEAQAAKERWRTINFPTVEVAVHDDADGEPHSKLLQRMQEYATDKLAAYEGLRVAYASSGPADYLVNIGFHKDNIGYYENVQVVSLNLNRIIWSNKSPTSPEYFDGGSGGALDDKFISESMFQISHPTGAIHTDQRKRTYRLDTPYGCWLYFSAQLQNNHTFGDEALENCASEWFSAAPNHPIAAALYGWNLVNKSMTRPTEASRAEMLGNAIAVLENARRVNPNSALLQTSAVRAYAFAGDSIAMHAVATQALNINPDNRDIKGLVGMMFTLWNDPEGEVLMNDAIAGHFNPPPWYYIGPFVSAMMHEDMASAAQALDQLKKFNHSLALRYIFTAAFEARSGHKDRALAAWEQAKAMQPILGTNPDIFFRRLPVAPVVRRRTLEWLAPVLSSEQGNHAGSGSQ